MLSSATRWVGRAAVVGTAVALPLGCGGQLSQAEYEAELRRLWSDRSVSERRLVGADVSSTDSAGRALRDHIEDLEAIAAAIGDLRPPDAAADENGDLAQGLSAYADDLRRPLAFLEDDDVPSARAAYAGIAAEGEAAQQMRDAVVRLRVAGFQVDDW